MNGVYFPADAEKIERTYHYVSLKQRTHADVVSKYEKDGKLKYVMRRIRHIPVVHVSSASCAGA